MSTGSFAGTLKAGLVAIGLATALAAPALAQDETRASDVPRCSATVTDHCMGRGDDGGGHRMGWHHKMGHGRGHGHWHHHGHHHHKHAM